MNAMPEQKWDELGSIDIEGSVGFAGHPGLASDIHELPFERSVRLRIRYCADELKGIVQILLHEEGSNHADLLAEDQNRRAGVSIENHGGLVLGTHSEILALHHYFGNTLSDKSYDKLWNQLADGVCELSLQTLKFGGRDASVAFICCQEYCATTELRDSEGILRGYRIECSLDHGGAVDPYPPDDLRRFRDAMDLGIIEVKVNASGFARCPKCDVSFPTESSKFHNGKHTTCGTRLKLVPNEA